MNLATVGDQNLVRTIERLQPRRLWPARRGKSNPGFWSRWGRARPKAEFNGRTPFLRRRLPEY